MRAFRFARIARETSMADISPPSGPGLGLRWYCCCSMVSAIKNNDRRYTMYMQQWWAVSNERAGLAVSHTSKLPIDDLLPHLTDQGTESNWRRTETLDEEGGHLRVSIAEPRGMVLNYDCDSKMSWEASSKRETEDYRWPARSRGVSIQDFLFEFKLRLSSAQSTADYRTRAETYSLRSDSIRSVLWWG